MIVIMHNPLMHLFAKYPYTGHLLSTTLNHSPNLNLNQKNVRIRGMKFEQTSQIPHTRWRNLCGQL